MKKSTALLVLGALCFAPLAAQAETVYVYGPGGPAPAMKAAAAAFTRSTGIPVRVTAGPTPAWRAKADADADLIYSGSENMMTDFLRAFPAIDADSVQPLYVRPAAILVHPGNPKHIHGFRDLLRPGVRVMVVDGAGQVGLWEDIAGRDGSLSTIVKLRHNIVFDAKNSAIALAKWTSHGAPDAWIIYNIWSIAHPGVAQVVKIEPHYAIVRDMGVSFTKAGERSADARRFRRFLTAPEGRAIFERFGWSP